MNEKALRKKIGDEKFEKIARHVEKLKAAGKGPDEIAEAIRSKFPEVARQVLVDVFTPIWMLVPRSGP